jgi:hypothetical protein
MLQIIINLLFIVVSPLAFATTDSTPAIKRPMKALYSHSVHQKALGDKDVSCTECHQFSVKSPGFDPLAANVPAGHLKVNHKVCHECHMGKVTNTRINQCSVCHEPTAKLAPKNHTLAWRTRHGQFAQMDASACMTCHQDNRLSCTNCHSQRNTLKPAVHRPNFRLTHSVEARANPASCVTCHSGPTTCIQCHQKGVVK